MKLPAGAGPAAGDDLVLGFDFGGTKVEVALAGPGQDVLGRLTLATDAPSGAEQAVARAVSAARRLLDEAGQRAPAAVGVSTMGLTREDGVDLAPNVPGWERLRLPAMLRAEFPGVPVELGNDVRAAAMAELMWGELADVATGVYVNLGTGVAAALIIGGALFTGGHGAAGEIGYWIGPRGQVLEAAIGGAGVRRRAAAVGIDGGLAELLGSSGAPARALAGEVLEEISAHLANLAIVIDPERMVLGGGYTRAGERILAAVRAGLRRHCPFPPEVVIGRFGSDVGVYGAIGLAERALGRVPAVRPAASTGGHVPRGQG